MHHVYKASTKISLRRGFVLVMFSNWLLVVEIWEVMEMYFLSQQMSM